MTIYQKYKEFVKSCITPVDDKISCYSYWFHIIEPKLNGVLSIFFYKTDADVLTEEEIDKEFERVYNETLSDLGIMRNILS